MPGPVQRVPPGLLELFGLKGLGATPRDLADAYVSTVAIEQFIARGTYQRVTATTTIAVPLGPSITVPADQVWLLTSLTGRVVTTATMTASLAVSLSISRAGQIPVVISYDRYLAPFLAGTFVYTTYVPNTPVLLMPGDIVAANLRELNTDATAAVHVDAAVGVISS